MDPNLNDNSLPHRLGRTGTQDYQSTRETESANARLCSMPRPPPTGEDSSENDRSKEGPFGQFKSESYEPPSPRLTPRRSTAKELQASSGGSFTTDEEKLAPLGFEPEGQAVSSPTFQERLGCCFTDMLTDCDGSYLFYQYLRRISRDILIDFCRACDDFRGMVPTSPQTRSTAKAIFQKYIFPRESSELLAIKESTRTKTAEHINDQPTDPLLFEQACSEVVGNLKNTYYESFVSSSFYKEFAETQCESPKIINDMTATNSGRFQGGYLPTLPEEKVLGFGEEIEEFEFDSDQQCKNAKGLSGLTYCGTNATSDEKNARKLLHNPAKDVNSPYYYPAAPLASITESESQSMSSDALTDDTLSMTTDTSEGHSRCSGGRRHSHRSRNNTNSLTSRLPFVPRTHRLPKEARNPLSPEEFFKVLSQKLEKVVIERQLQEREAINLSNSIDLESVGSGHSKKSILQEAIENKERQEKIPLSTMAIMPPLSVQDDTTSVSTSNHSSSKSTSANATAGSGAQNSSSSESTHKRSRSKHLSKASRHETDKSCNQVSHRESSNPPKPTHIPPDNAIPFLTVNHHRILEWMETGEEELQKQKICKARHPPKSRLSSSRRTDESYTGHNQPNQPIAQDPMMPLLPQPEATTVLGEVRRRLMESKEQDRKSRHNQKHRSRGSVDTSESMSSFQDKGSSTDCSSCAQSLLSYDLKPHQSCEASSTFSSSIPSSASNIANDTKSRSDSGIGGGVRKKEKHNSTTVIYWLWGEPIAYRTSLPGKHVTLGQFKTLILRRGEFRYFFKTKTDEEDRDCEVVYEEVRHDDMKLPLYEGKIVGKVEKVDS